MEVTKNQITDLLIAMVKIVKGCDEVDEALGMEAMMEKFGFQLDTLTDLVLDLCGVPKEGTPFAMLGIDTKGMPKGSVDYGFCRDTIKGTIYDNLENADFEREEDLELACDVCVIALLDEWLPDEEYIAERES